MNEIERKAQASTVRTAAIHIIYAAADRAPDEADYLAAIAAFRAARIDEGTVMDLQDAAAELADAGRRMTRHRANMVIAPLDHGQHAARLERRMAQAQARLARAFRPFDHLNEDAP